MSVSTSLGENEQFATRKSWLSSLSFVRRRISLFDLLFLALLAGWAGSRLDLIINHGLVGGSGDEGHRLVISYRLCHDFWGRIYSYFFHCPWPPLPYVIQAAAFRIQQALGGDSDYGTTAVCTSLGSFTFAVAFVYAALALRFQRLAGLLAAILLLSMRDMTTLAVTPMAESYCTFFLGMTLLFAALPQTLRGKAVLVGLALMLATQCRSETIVLSVVFGAYCLYQRGWMAGVGCTLISAFPFVVKAVVNYATGFSGMSYFNLAKFYRFENNWQDNAARALGTLRNYAHGELSFAGVAACLVLAAACAAALCRILSSRRSTSEPEYDSAYFGLMSGSACTLSSAIIMAMSASFVLPAPRYFVICHFLWSLPFAVAAARPLARLGKLCKEQAKYRPEFTPSRVRWLRFAASLTCVVALTCSFGLGAKCFQASAVSLYNEQAAHIPEPILSARDWLLKNGGRGGVCFDSLLWWETFLFFHNMRNDPEATQFMVYDPPLGNWKEGLQAEPGEHNVAVIQRYLEVFRPEFVVLAGPGYWGILKGIERFADLNEKPSYLRDFLQESESGTLEMNDAPYWKKGSSFSMTLHPAFQNDAVAIYRASYSDGVAAESASVRANPTR